MTERNKNHRQSFGGHRIAKLQSNFLRADDAPSIRFKDAHRLKEGDVIDFGNDDWRRIDTIYICPQTSLITLCAAVGQENLTRQVSKFETLTIR